MTEPSSQPVAARGVIRRDAVRIVRQPAQIDCGSSAHAGPSPLVVVPVLDGDQLAGFEIRCGCGTAAMVECVYAQET